MTHASTASFSIVVPTIGRESLYRLLAALDGEPGPSPESVVIVDDRPVPAPALQVDSRLPVTVLRSGGRGPAAARNTGWRATTTRWVCFVDDDVVPQPGWLAALAADLRGADAAGAAGTQAVIAVPVTEGRPATDDEKRTLRLAGARWITADMAYRRDILVEVGGFDERFPRAYREDSDIALRITLRHNTIVRGARRSTHPVARATLMSSVRAQIGNRDNALMRRKHGGRWRDAVGEGRGRMPAHVATTAAAAAATVAALTGRRRAAGYGAVAWTALTLEFTARRLLSGPRTLPEAGRLLLTSTLIPPAAVGHRLRGEWMFRGARRDPPLAVLLDRDDTIIEDGPYLNDPAGVKPMPGAAEALARLRDRGLLLAVVTNQSGVAKGLITDDQLAAVNARVDAELGPFDSWQICVHDNDDGCACRKPAPGMVRAAAEALGVDPARCVMIGDTGGDVGAALSASADAVLVPTERTLPHEVSEARRRARVAATLTDAVEMVLRDAR
ncbi:HAD family hydrolase [Mycobacterium sp. IS-1742]|uniref:HAD-IIIA family hydrolase n=1 Tax=Mycobacterium sp. IS-1742 TaxID=1772285 RepID=UPI0007400BF2|nr:HAD-IIIA family hydrolase [Mycobacterium sp. IS-1742]KUI23791.1 HAD family hydrolase [Mycobacterium sp. IS-1742]